MKDSLGSLVEYYVQHRDLVGVTSLKDYYNMENKEAINEITQFSKEYGFKKSGLVWWSAKEDFVILFDLQKSQWSDIYYINAGVSFHDLDTKNPKAYEADIKWRLIKNDSPKDGFSLSDSNQICELLKKQVFSPWLEFRSKSEIKEFLAENLERYLITISGREALGIPGV